jgi:hypothetical protein
MEKVLKVLKSKTVWTFVGLFVFNGLQAIQPMVSPEYVWLINGLVSLLGIYFRTAPKQQF